MALVIDDAFLPATLSSPMTDEEFAEFCSEHPDPRIEMTAEGELLLMAPTHSRTGLRNNHINRQLADR
jgi:Uma2 family endonuclease